MYSPREAITDDEHELAVAFGEAADEADADDDARDLPASVDAGEAESASAVPVVAADPFDTDAELRFPFGRIVYYASRREIVAECRHAGHGKRCRRTRTNNGDPAVPAQGRPLAHLALWIEHGSEYDNTDAHKWDYWPSLAERRAKRGEIMSAPEWAALLARERPKRIDEPDEPDDIV